MILNWDWLLKGVACVRIIQLAGDCKRVCFVLYSSNVTGTLS